MKSKSKSVIVVGAGIGGLSAAALLAKKGFNVKVIEKNSIPGGRAGILKAKGFTFDLGPSWFMMPDVFEKYLKEFDTSLDKQLDLISLDPQYRVFFEDKSYYDLGSNHDNNKKVFESIEKGSSGKYDKYLKDAENKYQLATDRIMYKDMNKLTSYLNLRLIKNGINRRNYENMQSHISRYFKSEKMRKILGYNLVFLGCSPNNAPALFSMMAHVDFNLGVYYPQGGFYKVVEMLYKLCTNNGVEFVFDSEVTSIKTDRNKVISVNTKGSIHKADVYVGNTDYKHLEDLIDDQDKRNITIEKWGEKTLAPSAFIIYLGVRGKIRKLSHHNLYFDDYWENHFKSVFDSPSWPVNPSIYINKPTATDPSVAPANHENLMILVPIGVGLEENENWKNSYAKYIISYLETNLDIDISQNVVYQKIFSITEFSKLYNSYKGNALGGIAHTLNQSAYFRPNMKSNKLSNLYFVGAGTNPGIGVPTSLISGQDVSKLIENEHS